MTAGIITIATSFAIAGLALMGLWWRERTPGLSWVAAGYALALGRLATLPGPAAVLAAVVPHGLVALGIARYLGAGRVAQAALVAPPLLAAWAAPTLAGGALAYLDLVLGGLCLAAARRERDAGRLLLAVASLGGLAAWMALWVAGSGAGHDEPTLIAFAIALPMAVALRERRTARTAEVMMQRTTNFYDALSRTNQTIARVKDAKALFEAICQICVDAGHARMACVYVLDGPLAWRAATAGPAAEILAGVPHPWDTSQPEARDSYTVEVLDQGRPLASNDYQNDPRAAPWRQLAVQHDVHAFAWLPFRRHGRVDGVLMLAAEAVGYFDAPLMRLLERMVDDISLALDAIDREAERVRAEQEARASLERFQLLFDAAPVPSAIVSVAERRIVAANDAYCVANGLTREAMLGRQTAELPLRLNEEDRETFYAELEREGRVRNRLLQVRWQDGTTRQQLFNAEAIEYLGEPCLLLVTMDVTDLREAEQARVAQARAEAASRAKTEFLSRMSHELRTPLNAVLGFTQLLRNGARERLTAQELTQLDLVQQAGWHLLTLINDVLDVSRVESGRVALDTRALALAPLLDEALQMNRSMAERNAVALHADYEAAPPLAVRADPTRLRQVLLNLLSNAIKYNRAGGSVRIALAAEEGRVRLEIADTGLGMTQEQLAHLFEPFNRLGRERGAIEGTGIGLVLTRQLLRLMHSEIEVDSEAGRGTRVRVTLPQAEAAAIEIPGRPLPSGTELPEGTVLYVEDNDVNALLVEQLLARWVGVRFVHALNGRDGVELACTLQPDLVLLDMQLPDIDGLEVLRRVKAEPATRELRVVALSASAMAEDVARAKELGVAEYWTKPLDFDRFLADVARLLGDAGAQPAPAVA